MKIYQIDSSARKKGSTSRALAKKLLDKIKKPGDEVIYRDLDDEMLFVSGLTESGMNIDEKDQTEEQKKMFELSDKLVKELKAKDLKKLKSAGCDLILPKSSLVKNLPSVIAELS